MRKTALVVLLVAMSSSAFAERRHNVSNLSCDRVQAILQAEGAATLQYRSKRNPSLPLYDRYVRDAGFCRGSHQILTGTSIPVAGGKSCRVRKCQRIESD